MRRFDAEKLRATMTRVLGARGVAPEAVAHVVASVIQTSLRGVDSHGIQLFPHYARVAETGRINLAPKLAFEQTAPGTAILDADHAYGHHAGAVAMDHAIQCAKQVGIAVVAVRNSSHFGAAAYFALRAPAAGCIGLAFTNADALVKATGAKHSFTGTNPICFTAPIEGEQPFCFDAATSLVSWNKVVNARRTGGSLGEDWACDENGLPVTDANAARSLQPAGLYKGYGLSIVVDILCALLAGGGISKDLLPMYKHVEVRRAISHCFMAIDVARFAALGDFAHRMKDMVERARGLEPLDPAAPVMVPGDPEKRAFAERTARGIPIDDAKLAEFIATSADFESALLP
ncbi:MAG TPA: Ldh family oxidoreductase [Kofleriaceae bacterium]|nr:Ldh family oxidoreductase [Kofleriaceae bacterium]